MATESAAEVAAEPRCGCGQAVEQPWRTRDTWWSPASVIGWLVWFALGLWLVLAGRTIAGGVVLGVLGALIVGSLVLQAVRRHRGWCWLRRGLWFGMAAAGLPWRIAGALNF
ncbi:hypothetical protein [Kribbella sp. NPDC048915]|uniref:hypothetical protein n=1 Tax=Kribbella sp. NPDC048915 TaxID=3155148 RepID=UPI0034060FEA